MLSELKPQFFATPNDFRKWLEVNHQLYSELLVGFYKVGTGKPSITWSQSVDQALCFGWIDSVRKSIDQESYCIRFTPRKPNSIWSAINIKKVEELTKQGLMKAEGLAIYNQRLEHKSKIYTHEIDTVKLSKEFLILFKKHINAWQFFNKLPLSYQKSAIHWVMGAKQVGTRLKRLNELISASEQNQKIKSLDY